MTPTAADLSAPPGGTGRSASADGTFATGELLRPLAHWGSWNWTLQPGAEEGAMCLGEHGVITDVGADGRGRVRFDDGRVQKVSLAVPIVEGIEVAAGDRVLVSIGMVLQVERPASEVEQENMT